jgi:hypothetical protein
LAGHTHLVVTEHPLVQLARLAPPPTTVSECQVVEHQQLAGPKDDVDHDVLDVQTVLPEERQFRTRGPELRSTEKVRLRLHAGQERRVG